MKIILETIVCVLLFIFIWRQSFRFYHRHEMIKKIKNKQK